ncbi:alpha/beta fold hydrolase [Aestuariivita boseongensis]|uniref:alpha/beta fold hydrolase n=1 Tax=Aestuariivita boseongensis TaxID=1470562 RepID=UPI000681D401|nr:alpha/beta hydrolase [Aestuariivita boseongensis]
MPHYTAPDGLSLYYTDEGEGLPILCLSGLTRNTADFDYVTPHLSGHRLIKTDYRGRGQSDWAKDHMTYTIPVEVGDVLALMDHLGLEKAAILGTSRGGLVAMGMGVAAPDRIMGVAFNDIGPVIEPVGIEFIKNYIGRNPVWKTHEEAARELPKVMTGFDNIPESRWEAEVRKLYNQTDDGLEITYDPRLRDAVLEAGAQPAPDLWPLFDGLAGKPMAVIRGANSNLLSEETVAEMARRAPGLIVAEVPDRGHIPFLDEPPAVAALQEWIGKIK